MTKGAAAASDIVDRLDRAYPSATYALIWTTPWELLVLTILAAQATDATVNRVTVGLYSRHGRGG